MLKIDHVGKIWRDKARALAHWARKLKSIVIYLCYLIDIALNSYLDKLLN